MPRLLSKEEKDLRQLKADIKENKNRLVEIEEELKDARYHRDFLIWTMIRNGWANQTEIGKTYGISNVRAHHIFWVMEEAHIEDLKDRNASLENCHRKRRRGNGNDNNETSIVQKRNNTSDPIYSRNGMVSTRKNL